MANRWFKGILAGGVLGFIGGLLFAPQKGDRTRKQVKDMADKAATISADVRQKGEKFLNQIIEDKNKE
jgi:gas vesicle protein